MKLVEVRTEDRELLWNINQKYLYEMTNYYDDELDVQGNLHYGYFDAYFTDPERKAFFIYDEQNLVGFAMIHPYSFSGGETDHVMAEFTIFPMYRKNHLATKAAESILERFQGRWEIKFNEKNAAAKGLWVKVTAKYSPELIHLNEEETVLSFRTE